MCFKSHLNKCLIPKQVTLRIIGTEFRAVPKVISVIVICRVWWPYTWQINLIVICACQRFHT